MSWTLEAGTRHLQSAFPDAVPLPDGRWRLYFQSRGEIMSAVSSDGLVFADESGIRVPRGAYDGSADSSTHRRPDGTFLMVYRADIAQRYSDDSINQTTNLLLAASSGDGLAFGPGTIVVDGRNDLYVGTVVGPELVEMEDGALHLFFWTSAGRRNQDKAGMYEALSTDGGRTWGEPRLAVSLQQEMGGEMWGDPTFARVGSAWHMYFGQVGAESGIHYATRPVGLSVPAGLAVVLAGLGVAGRRETYRTRGQSYPGRSTVEPTVARDSSARWAAATSASGITA